MAITDGNAPLGNWQLRPTKLRAYEALQTMNRCFEATILSLERLDQLNVFRAEFLNAYKVTLEYTRAQANEELIESLRGLEQHDTCRFGNMQDDWDKQNRDPDDVLLHTQERREEIKEQMRTLQRALKRKAGRKKR
jgi:hypothetical protein